MTPHVALSSNKNAKIEMENVRDFRVAKHYTKQQHTGCVCVLCGKAMCIVRLGALFFIDMLYRYLPESL